MAHVQGSTNESTVMLVVENTKTIRKTRGYILIPILP